MVENTIALNGDDLLVAQGVEKVEGERLSIGAVLHLHRAGAHLFQCEIDMLSGELVRFGRADHANFASEFFREQGRAKIVTTHVRGQNYRALRFDQATEKLRALY